VLSISMSLFTEAWKFLDGRRKGRFKRVVARVKRSISETKVCFMSA